MTSDKARLQFYEEMCIRDSKKPVRMDYLDDIDIAEFKEIPTYKRMCICIGNGISLIIMIGIIARLPQSLFQELISRMTDKTGGLVMFLHELVVLLLVIAFEMCIRDRVQS